MKIETLNPILKGGQHAGVDSTGVRVTHLLSGLTATCDHERSQYRNKTVALAMIEAGVARLGLLL